MAQKRNTYTSSTDVGKIKELNERYALTIGDIADVLDVAPKTLSRWTKKIIKNPVLYLNEGVTVFRF